MHFSANDIERFAAWSGDHNPQHVDRHFAVEAGLARPVAHGMLSVMSALGSIQPRSANPLRTLEIEFHGAVLSDQACDLESVREPAELSLTIRSDENAIVAIRGKFGRAARPVHKADLAWLAELADKPASSDAGQCLDPIDRNFDDFQSEVEIMGVYATDPPPDAATASGCLTPLQARILGLCSYLVGMEAPGLRSQLIEARLSFDERETDSNVLWYCARTVAFDRQRRIVGTNFEITTPEGRLVATGELQSYVRISPIAVDLAALSARLEPAASHLAGKTALVCGGSRGLGANVAAALALAGCRVYASYHGGSDAAQRLAKMLAKQNVQVEFLKGDAGDPAWCRSALETLRNRHGGLDILVLNASAAPGTFRLGPDSAKSFDEYMTANVRLACTPLATFLPILDESRGAIACISSAHVSEAQPGFAHFATLKHAVEGALHAAACEAPGVYSLIVRPPRLLTSWNDSPDSFSGAMPAEQVASQLVNRLAGEWQPGEVHVLSSFSAADPTPGELCEVAASPPATASSPLKDGDWLRADAVLPEFDESSAVEPLPAIHAGVEADYDDFCAPCEDSAPTPVLGAVYERNDEASETIEEPMSEEVSAEQQLYDFLTVLHDEVSPALIWSEPDDVAAEEDTLEISAEFLPRPFAPEESPPVTPVPTGDLSGVCSAASVQCSEPLVETLLSEVVCHEAAATREALTTPEPVARQEAIAHNDSVAVPESVATQEAVSVDEIAAFTLSAAVRLKIGAEERLTPWLVESETPIAEHNLNACRRQIRETRDSVPFSLALARTDAMRAMLVELGWQAVAPLETAELIIHPDTVLKARPAGTAPLAGWGWRATTAVRTILQHRMPLDVQQVTRFDVRHDRLWQLAANDFSCGVVHDASYLNDKYIDVPGRQNVRLEVVEGDTVRGVVVMTFREADEVCPYRRAFLVDMVAPLSDTRLLKQLVQIASTAAGERDADALLCLHVGERLTRALRQNGFLIREPDRFLLVNPGQLPEEARQRALAAGDWFLTQSDAGIDRV